MSYCFPAYAAEAPPATALHELRPSSIPGLQNNLNRRKLRSLSIGVELGGGSGSFKRSNSSRLDAHPSAHAHIQSVVTYTRSHSASAASIPQYMCRNMSNIICRSRSSQISSSIILRGGSCFARSAARWMKISGREPLIGRTPVTMVSVCDTEQTTLRFEKVNRASIANPRLHAYANTALIEFPGKSNTSITTSHHSAILSTMRGSNAFPFVLAGLFGVMNGVYIFKPALEELAQSKLENDLKAKSGAGKKEAPAALDDTVATAPVEEKKLE
ncbi:hypothetical protein EDC01DRAFT_628393 [Geopyxis carbonaria]|nr:hypothetical protein EDC01DRAFT_628393 [Geopyxis carbonaria]